MSINFLVLGGGILGLGGEGGSADFIFMGAGTFLSLLNSCSTTLAAAEAPRESPRLMLENKACQVRLIVTALISKGTARPFVYFFLF